MNEQYSLFDIDTENKGPACVYKFKRYIGQKVVFWRDGTVGTVREIEPYYTIVETGKKLLAGTPTTIGEVKE